MPKDEKENGHHLAGGQGFRSIQGFFLVLPGPMQTAGYVGLCLQTWLAQPGLGPCDDRPSVHWLRRGLASIPVLRRRGSLDTLVPPTEHLLCAQP